MPAKKTQDPEDLDPALAEEADLMFAEQPPSPTLSPKQSKKASQTPKGESPAVSAGGNPLAEVKKILQDEVAIDTLNELKLSREMARARIQNQMQNPQGQYVPQGSPQIGQPQSQPLPIPIPTPVGPDGKPDPNMALTMAAVQSNPNFAMMMLLPQLMNMFGAGKTGEDSFLKALQAINEIKGPAPNQVDALQANLNFLKMFMEVTGATRQQQPSQGMDVGGLLTGIMGIFNQMNQQSQARADALQNQIMQMQNEKLQQLQMAASADPFEPLKRMEDFAGFFQKWQGLTGPQAANPETTIALKKLDLEIEEKKRLAALDERRAQSDENKSKGWMDTFEKIGTKVMDQLSGGFGQQIGEGVKDSLMAAARAQLQGMPIQQQPLAQGPIVSVPQPIPQQPAQMIQPQTVPIQPPPQAMPPMPQTPMTQGAPAMPPQVSPNTQPLPGDMSSTGPAPSSYLIPSPGPQRRLV